MNIQIILLKLAVFNKKKTKTEVILEGKRF